MNDVSPFKGLFSAMYKTLHINCDILAKRNYKGIFFIEKFQRFIINAITVSVEDIGTNDVFVAAGVTVECVYNSSPIDVANILRSYLTVGRELQYPLEFI